jgi:hypothetical protein
MERGIDIPDNNDADVIDHYSTYPDGHNPSKPQLQNLINQVKEKRNTLLIGAMGFSVLTSILVISYLTYHEYYNKIKIEKTTTLK